ncbi:hypothetical protein LCGC14_1295050 [marine sediment metagenome]|uniref:Uncharacterized protein n=1 Tax=marine sediment metagenome TaxID=412755 RepID=A0A0F9LC55_9ZZZZ
MPSESWSTLNTRNTLYVSKRMNVQHARGLAIVIGSLMEILALNRKCPPATTVQGQAWYTQERMDNNCQHLVHKYDTFFRMAPW